MMLKRLTLPAVLLVATTLPRVARADASAELYQTEAYVYGRFEARIQYAPGDGVVSSFFLWKEGSEAAGAFWNELDFEKVGANCEVRTNALFGNPGTSHHAGNQPVGDLCSAYHDYRFDWTPSYIAWAVDGVEVRRDTGETATAFAQNASAGMTMHFNVWPGDETFGGNYNPSILPVYQYVSWVQYSSYDGNNFNFEWRQDFDGDALPSGWEAGDWSSPKGRSTHNVNNVGLVNGIAVLALTTDGATGLPSTVPADGAATGGAGTGGTSSGGADTGGSETGGMATGGDGSGGADTGGSETGGLATGGDVPGGAETGGGETGGLATGGDGSGGAETGGGETGGLATGGQSVGGTSSGGASTGGSTTGATDPGTLGGGPAGGSGTGGAATGGTAAGGVGNTSATGATGAAVGTTGGGGPVMNTGGNPQDGPAATETSPADAGSDDGGCSCRVQSGEGRGAWRSGFGLLALLLLGRRRQNRLGS
jgi:endo-1,3-1,4-beta-glycanase ExoK